MILENLAKNNPILKIVSFSRNFGHQIAYTAGMDVACGDAVIVIDGDLQDPPELINNFILEWENGYEVVYGVRSDREGETFMKKFSAKLFYKFLDSISDTKIPKNSGDFRLMDRKIVDVFKQMPERARYIRGMISWIGYQQKAIEYKRLARSKGETKYTLNKMFNLASNGIISFSKAPLKIAFLIGIATLFLSIIGIFYALGLRIFSDIWVEGWTFLAIIILFFGGLQILILGIIGEYLAVIFDESKSRPLYIIDRVIHYEKE
jgi:dolichol-phosphate mannosyltransferase